MLPGLFLIAFSSCSRRWPRWLAGAACLCRACAAFAVLAPLPPSKGFQGAWRQGIIDGGASSRRAAHPPANAASTSSSAPMSTCPQVSSIAISSPASSRQSRQSLEERARAPSTRSTGARTHPRSVAPAGIVRSEAGIRARAPGCERAERRPRRSRGCRARRSRGDSPSGPPALWAQTPSPFIQSLSSARGISSERSAKSSRKRLKPLVTAMREDSLWSSSYSAR